MQMAGSSTDSNSMGVCRITVNIRNAGSHLLLDIDSMCFCSSSIQETILAIGESRKFVTNMNWSSANALKILL
jgi:hypothetical protein